MVPSTKDTSLVLRHQFDADSSLFSVIIRVRVVFRKTVVGD